jgi:hypothetical protein
MRCLTHRFRFTFTRKKSSYSSKYSYFGFGLTCSGRNCGSYARIVICSIDTTHNSPLAAYYTIPPPIVKLFKKIHSDFIIFYENQFIDCACDGGLADTIEHFSEENASSTGFYRAVTLIASQFSPIRHRQIDYNFYFFKMLGI